MTAHDFGRVAQLDYIANRQLTGLPGGNRDTVNMLDHLGLSDGDSSAACDSK